jgi:carbamate kinase
VVHGNGPQVGDELVRNEIARYDAPPLPLGVLVAATAGWIGYMVQQSIDNALRRTGSPRDVATIITQVVVDPNDAALQDPTKFIGRELPEERAEELQRAGFSVKLDGHGRVRRVVGSPKPLAIRELPSIRQLLDAGSVGVACGGGGAPIYDDPRLGWEADAVVDKDLAAAVARDLGAELPPILTDVDAVRDWGTPHQRPLPRLTIEAVQMDRDGASAKAAWRRRSAPGWTRCTGGRDHHGAEKGRVRGEAGTTITTTALGAEHVNIHEFQAKDILRRAGVRIPPGHASKRLTRRRDRARFRRHRRHQGASARRWTR